MATDAALTTHSTVAPADGQVASTLGEEIVILNLSGGGYYGLDGVGARVWELIQEPRTIGQVCEQICAEYEVTRETCTADVFALVKAMEEAGIVEVA